MSLSTPQPKPALFDTLAWANELRSVGFSEAQATVQTKLFKLFIDDHIATQGDVHDVRLEIEKLRQETQQFRHEMQSEIEKSRHETQGSIEKLRQETQSEIQKFRHETQSEIEKTRAEAKESTNQLKLDIEKVRGEIKSSMWNTIIILGSLVTVLMSVFRFVHV